MAILSPISGSQVCEFGSLAQRLFAPLDRLEFSYTDDLHSNPEDWKESALAMGLVTKYTLEKPRKYAI
jgi:hypothetical protein